MGIHALVMTHAMLRRLTSWRCIIIIIIHGDGKNLRYWTKMAQFSTEIAVYLRNGTR